MTIVIPKYRLSWLVVIPTVSAVHFKAPAHFHVMERNLHTRGKFANLHMTVAAGISAIRQLSTATFWSGSCASFGGQL